jgi:hypothetical protein
MVEAINEALGLLVKLKNCDLFKGYKKPKKVIK